MGNVLIKAGNIDISVPIFYCIEGYLGFGGGLVDIENQIDMYPDLTLWIPRVRRLEATSIAV